MQLDLLMTFKIFIFVMASSLGIRDGLNLHAVSSVCNMGSCYFLPQRLILNGVAGRHKQHQEDKS